MNVKEEANCILAEIVRLAAFVSEDFTDPSSSKYKIMVLDFNYFTRPTYYEKQIDENEELQDSFYNTYRELLSRYCDQVGSERVGISYLDIIDIEILFNIGLVLLYLETYFPGPGINDFGNAFVDRITLVKWTYVCLLFKPSTLKSDFSKMRQVVEDFFRDEWVLQLGLGLNVNLLDSWCSYRAALAAITSQVDLTKAKDMAAYHYNALSKLTIPQAREMADFEENFSLADATHTISNLSLGVSRMTLKKVGLVSINPKVRALPEP
ncbi:hypothetical protein NECAME_14796 [Necator americanus]|uniref:Uncharacterized protein n=1 Tax=Necator americanus TaxID=51031 RepID=W2SLB7_NECAM|nr:hypothetical protein NECAME_14796 [Necator americanus]ETN70405.1 hypothetical protein NECAME_14796 [Necator americanus]